jgi:hypothetical protein
VPAIKGRRGFVRDRDAEVAKALLELALDAPCVIEDDGAFGGVHRTIQDRVLVRLCPLGHRPFTWWPIVRCVPFIPQR